MWQALHVPSLVCAMRGAALRADHVVAAIELGRQRLGGSVALGLLLAGLRLDLAELRVDVALAGPELVRELLVLGLRRLDLLPRRLGFGDELADLLLAIAHQLAQLLELALRGVGLALGPRPGRASRASARAAGSCCVRPGQALRASCPWPPWRRAPRRAFRRAWRCRTRSPSSVERSCESCSCSSLSSASICASFSSARIWSRMLNA